MNLNVPTRNYYIHIIIPPKDKRNRHLSHDTGMWCYLSQIKSNLFIKYSSGQDMLTILFGFRKSRQPNSGKFSIPSNSIVKIKSSELTISILSFLRHKMLFPIYRKPTTTITVIHLKSNDICQFKLSPCENIIHNFGYIL